MATLRSETRELLDEADGFASMGRALVELGRRWIGVSGVTVFPLGTCSVEDSPPVSFAEAWSEDESRRQLNRMLPRAATEIDALGVGLRSGRTFILGDQFQRDQLARTETFNEFWRPGRLEEQTFGIVGGTHGPGAFLCLARSAKDRRFNEAELRAAEHLRTEAERTMRRLQAEGALPNPPVDPDKLLTILQTGLSFPCALLDAQGRVLWMSDETVRLLDADAVFFGASRLVGRSPRLAAWREIARSCGRGAAPSPELLRLSGVTSCHREVLGERVAVLLVAQPAPRPDWKVVLVCAGLSAREAQVAWMLARGHSVLNIAATLSLSEHTVRVHEKRVHGKLRVSTRAELLLKVQSLVAQP